MEGIILVKANSDLLDENRGKVIKELLPVYDRPLIQFSIAMLMQLGIRSITIATPESKLDTLKNSLRSVSDVGVHFNYHVYRPERGECDALLSKSIETVHDSLVVIESDNVFYGEPFNETIIKATARNPGVTRFGLRKGRSNHARELATLAGLYLYDGTVKDRVEELYTRGHKNDLEDLNLSYERAGNSSCELLNPWVAWMKVGDYESLLSASNFIFQLEQNQGIRLACIEAIAYQLGFISKSQFYKLYKNTSNIIHARYLLNFLENRRKVSVNNMEEITY